MAVAFPVEAAAALAALRAASAEFLIKVRRNCISMTKYVTIDVTVLKRKQLQLTLTNYCVKANGAIINTSYESGSDGFMTWPDKIV